MDIVIRMHRYLMNCPDDMDVDHRNGDGLDNRTSNLRVVTASQNLMNQRPQKGKSSQYKGVSLHKATGHWTAYIKLGGKKVHLGYSESEIEAALMYDRAAKCEYGEYALVNFNDNYQQMGGINVVVNEQASASTEC